MPKILTTTDTARVGSHVSSYNVFRGRSVDGTPILAVISGLTRRQSRRSKNAKTGPMSQLSVYVDNGVSPGANVRTGEDKGVCNDCPLRPSEASQCRECGATVAVGPHIWKCKQCGTINLRCYVVTDKGEASKHKAAEPRPVDTSGALAVIASDPSIRVRFGAYGNMSNIPRAALEPLLEACTDRPKGWTLYEHQWRRPEFQWLRAWAMASVSTLAEARDAWALGWRTFRAREPGESLQSGEIECPSSRGVSCYDCGLCNGVGPQSERACVKSVSIPGH